MIDIKQISPEMAYELTNKGITIIDVREPDEIAQMAFDIPNIIKIPFSKFDEKYIVIPKGKKVILACHLGIRSLRAAQFLVVQGWDEANVFSLEGGIAAWKNHRLPVKSAPKTFSMAKPVSAGCCGGSASGSCC